MQGGLPAAICNSHRVSRCGPGRTAAMRHAFYAWTVTSSYTTASCIGQCGPALPPLPVQVC